MAPPARQDYALTGAKESNPVKIDFLCCGGPRRRGCLPPLAAAQSSDLASGATAPRRRGRRIPGVATGRRPSSCRLDAPQLTAPVSDASGPHRPSTDGLRRSYDVHKLRRPSTPPCHPQIRKDRPDGKACRSPNLVRDPVVANPTITQGSGLGGDSSALPSAPNRAPAAPPDP